MVQMDRCKLTLDLPKFQPMKEQDSHLLSNQRPALTLDLPKVIIAPPSDNGLVFFWTSEARRFERRYKVAVRVDQSQILTLQLNSRHHTEK